LTQSTGNEIQATTEKWTSIFLKFYTMEYHEV